MITLLLPASHAPAEHIPAEQVEETLRKAAAYFQSISTSGGYAGIYSLDLEKRYGEGLYEPVSPTQIWVQPPGTPAIGDSLLRAHLITGESMYLAAAREAGRALCWGQRKAGGWDHLADVSRLRPDSVYPERKRGACTFDDNITQGALSFLINLDAVLDEEWLSDSIRLGLNHILASQFENGAWPQWNPLKWWHYFFNGYHDYYTFNDGAINDCIKVLLKAHGTFKEDALLISAASGGDFIIFSQRAGPQAGWAQQYSHDMEPARARSFEPPGLCSAVTARNITTLVDLFLYTKDERFLAPIPAAIAWLEESKIGKNQWARLYELETNRPIYGDKDGKIHYDYNEISEERKRGYAWQAEFGIASAIGYYNEVKKIGAAEYLARSSSPINPAQRVQKADQLGQEVKAIIASLDEKGRWIDDGKIYSSTFVRNVNLLCDYLELVAVSP